MLSAALMLSIAAAVPTSSVAVTAALEDGPSIVERFRGSAASFTTSASLEALGQRQQLTYNPQVVSSLVVAPMFNLGGDFAAIARLGFSYEWTNSDFTKTEGEPLLLDTTLGVNYNGLPTLPWGTNVGLSARLTLPTSKISQARTMLVAPSVNAVVSHTFDNVLSGDVLVAAAGTYQHPFYRFTTPGLDVEASYAPQCFGGELGCVDQASGVANASDILSWAVLASGRWWIFSPGASFSMSHQFPFGFDDLPGVQRVFDTSTVRVTSSFGVWTDVDIVEGAVARVGYSLDRNILAGDGDIGNLIYDRYQDGQFYVTLTLGPVIPLR